MHERDRAQVLPGLHVTLDFRSTYLPYAVGTAVDLGTAQCPRLPVITGVTSRVLQVDGTAHVISADRHDVRLVTGVKGVVRRRQPSVVGRVVVAVTVVAVRRPRSRVWLSDRPGRKRPTMPERPVTKAAARRMPASVAPAATEIKSATARKITVIRTYNYRCDPRCP